MFYSQLGYNVDCLRSTSTTNSTESNGFFSFFFLVDFLFSTLIIHAQNIMKFLAENNLIKSSGNSSHALDRFGDA